MKTKYIKVAEVSGLLKDVLASKIWNKIEDDITQTAGIIEDITVKAGKSLFNNAVINRLVFTKLVEDQGDIHSDILKALLKNDAFKQDVLANIDTFLKTIITATEKAIDGTKAQTLSAIVDLMNANKDAFKVTNHDNAFNLVALCIKSGFSEEHMKNLINNPNFIAIEHQSKAFFSLNNLLTIIGDHIYGAKAANFTAAFKALDARFTTPMVVAKVVTKGNTTEDSNSSVDVSTTTSDSASSSEQNKKASDIDSSTSSGNVDVSTKTSDSASSSDQNSTPLDKNNDTPSTPVKSTREAITKLYEEHQVEPEEASDAPLLFIKQYFDTANKGKSKYVEFFKEIKNLEGSISNGSFDRYDHAEQLKAFVHQFFSYVKDDVVMKEYRDPCVIYESKTGTKKITVDLASEIPDELLLSDVINKDSVENKHCATASFNSDGDLPTAKFFGGSNEGSASQAFANIGVIYSLFYNEQLPE